MFGNTPFNDQKDGNVDMTISGQFPYFNYSSQIIPQKINNSKIRFRSMIAIGNPIVDISAEITQVTYIPGGSIQNTLRVAAWCLYMNPENINLFKVTMLGATGNDTYSNKIISAFNQSGVNHILQKIPNMETSRCGVGIHQKERCLVPQIKASNCLTEDFVNEHEKELMSHDALLIEGYFLQEKYDLCLNLCTKFKDQRKVVILTLSAVTIVQQHKDKIMEIANYSDIIVGNMGELETLAEMNGMDYKTTFEKVSKNLTIKKDRLFLITHGSKGAIVGKYDYTRGNMDFILQCFPSVMKILIYVDKSFGDRSVCFDTSVT